jgi:NAD(P)-dependent dehydrogenase (short-subunit alcohol dehydrogenase family)
MTRQQQIVTGIAATGIGVAALAHLMRERHAILFEGRVVLITGGSRGLGLELARAFVERGAHVALLARDEDELQRAQHDLALRGARVFIVAADVRRRDDVERAVQKVVNHYGRLDVLVNNAGVIAVGPLEHMTMEDFEEAMGVHYWGPMYMIRTALPHLRRSAGARIVNVASIGGKLAVPHLAPYSGSKFALVGLSDAFRAELAKEGIRVTTVCPGLMRTGSAINATFKGQHASEFTWFTIADSLPVVSVNARRAAREIVDACRVGAPSLVIGAPARLAALAQGIAPGVVGGIARLATWMLPGPDGTVGNEARMGRDSRARWVPSLLTVLGNRAARRNNESERARPIEATSG